MRSLSELFKKLFGNKNDNSTVQEREVASELEAENKN